mgnify:CR=1 FL=1
MNNIPVAKVYRPMPGVNISSLPIARNVTPLKKKQAVKGNSKHNRRHQRRTNRRGRASENRGARGSSSSEYEEDSDDEEWEWVEEE